MRFALIVSVLLIVISCKKEPLLDAAPSLVGKWKHYSAADDWHIIHIKEDGNGSMEWYIDGKLYRDTKERAWFMKDNILHFGKAAFNGELYEVQTYPSISGSTQIKNFDTLQAGRAYIILDGNYYVGM